MVVYDYKCFMVIYLIVVITMDSIKICVIYYTLINLIFKLKLTKKTTTPAALWFCACIDIQGLLRDPFLFNAGNTKLKP